MNAEDLSNVVFRRADETGEGGEVRCSIAGQRYEGVMFAAGALDGTAADDALAVGEQDDFEWHGGQVGCSSGEVVAIFGIETGQVDLVVEQVVQCVDRKSVV